ncbi:uncharacterized protein MELLADRAFT_107519 [Melampsora larici-populina 98AG31]|uniref:Uncharacterized protein n=1 Tax=Melampsora larici-populina (strain 98AG31 / pathotype 3-4-7) TaxID=747676 RepID=F4RQI6_MELLP|nr:uncharacterized protein MELLADRAFT_107519 [Melampsora larici-populina 98AG31]EGG05506.1 hypothetical protein MELLADRAFT_107519 [Melampsora larici-populina 98AG31]
MISDILPGQVFPKGPTPAVQFVEKGWPIQIWQDDANSLIKTYQIAKGFRGCTNLLKRNWLSDIDNGYFKLEKIDPAESLIPTSNIINHSITKTPLKNKPSSPSDPILSADDATDHPTKKRKRKMKEAKEKIVKKRKKEKDDEEIESSEIEDINFPSSDEFSEDSDDFKGDSGSSSSSENDDV